MCAAVPRRRDMHAVPRVTARATRFIAKRICFFCLKKLFCAFIIFFRQKHYFRHA
jgi:hypothetical protein